MRETADRFSPYVSETTLVVSASKGIENKTHMTMSQVLKEKLSHIPEKRFAVISGPSFAKEVARKVPTLVTVAAVDIETARFIQRIFATQYFRVYTNTDLIGVELGGAVKNVIAIAAGIVDGLGLGLNTRAALITRGLTELRRLGKAMGAEPMTFAGLSGIGDLLLTCTGALSRNYTVGKKIGMGKILNEILSEMKMVAEGVKTARSLYNLSNKLDVEMPICHEIYHILYDTEDPRVSIRRLMTRDLKHELDE
jgi:glycerol-3-phosphate dehydrogenase (NAD(P)+)